MLTQGTKDMIKNLTIDNYRVFNHFSVDSLARVNLIVGMNNSGKSSLLEAIYLLTSDDVGSSLVYLLNERGEFVSRSSDSRYEKRPLGGYQTSHIFHGRDLKSGRVAIIRSEGERAASLQLSLGEARAAQLHFPLLSLLDEEDLAPENRYLALNLEHKLAGREPTRETLRVTEDGLLYASRGYSHKLASTDQGSRFVTTNYLAYDELAVLWDNITLTPREDKVVEALQILEPNVDRISFTSRQTSNSGILVKLKNEREPIPLGSMGDGMRRILAITASLVNVENGTLLVDEIDTGLYYGALTDTWRLILETASRRHAQVFATTHSWDCVRAFQEALTESRDPNAGRLIRLEKQNNHIRTVTYSIDELDIAIEQGIEVR